MNYHLVIAENQTNTNAGFQDTEKAKEEGTQTYVLFPMLSDDHDDDIQKSVSPDIHSSSSGAQTRKQGDKTENKDKGKSPVVTITGFRDLNAEFKEYNNNSSNGFNAASSLVSTTGHNSINSTNDFSAAVPSNAAMPNLEDLSHSNDEDDVGAEADINNLESIISVSPIPTTRIYKDHPTSQIIGDLSLTTQTRSMARAVRDQGGISQMFNEDFYTCMFACFLSQEEPKRVHQALKDQRFEDPKNPDKVYKVVKALYGLHQAPRAWSLGKAKEGWDTYQEAFTEGLQLVKMLMCTHIGASLDRKSTTRGCQFLGCRLISWQCKKQTVVATSSTEAEYVAAASGCAQVLWIQNQLLDYGGSYIHYALTVNPRIYISCIKQFWNTASVKHSGDVTRLQALVDKKKIVISEVVIRKILQFDDAEGVVCLPNKEFFAGLAQMGYEKPSTKLTFYKAFFSS
nr:putative ribonuclease H-like domain-containing protein [Tanacetum cinerariifolium]